MMVKETAEVRKLRAKGAQSRLPKGTSQESHSHPAETRPAGSTMDKSEYIRNSLLALGAPSISAEEMRRLCKGPLGDALLFVAEHMKGRTEVNQARVAIQRYVVFIHFDT